MLEIMKYLCFVLIIGFTSGFLNRYRRYSKVRFAEDEVGEPLILTPLIEQNQIKEAQEAARVSLAGAKSIESYSGYLTVNKEYNSNTFFWYFPSKYRPETDPVVLWLQGGPGVSSLFGLFAEHGPFLVTSYDKLQLRKISWVNNQSVIYMDNPVGSGFSFTNNGYATNENQIGNDLYIAMIQFFKLFPQLQKNDFFIAGQTYAGKFVPALGYTIMNRNPTAQLKINLQGMAIGNSYSDPINQLATGEYLYQLGMIDFNQWKTYEMAEALAKQYIEQNDRLAAFKVFEEIAGYYAIFTYLPDAENVLYGVKSIWNLKDNYERYIERPEIRKALHVGKTKFDEVSAFDPLIEDISQSVAPWILELLQKYRMMFYCGQLDSTVNYSSVRNFLKDIGVSIDPKYLSQPYLGWKVEGNFAGFSKTTGNLVVVLVRNTGSMVPFEQPEWALDMIIRFTRNIPFYKTIMEK